MAHTSILIATRSGQPPGRALDSAHWQTQADCEVLLCDGPDACAAWRSALPRASGQYVLLLRGDDALAPGHVAQLAAILDREPGLGVAFFDIANADATATRLLDLDGADGAGLGALCSALPLLRRACVERAALLDAVDCADVWRRIAAAGYRVRDSDRQLLCREHIAQALRCAHGHDLAAAARHLAAAVQAWPELTHQPEIFLRSVVEYVTQPDVADPLALAQTILNCLPPQARHLQRVRRRLLGTLYVEGGFGANGAGARARARRQMLRGLRNAPAFATNKGVLAVLGRTLLPTRAARSARAGVSATVLSQVAAAMGEPVTALRATAGGTNRNTFFVQLGARRCLVRVINRDNAAALARRLVRVLELALATGACVPRILAWNAGDAARREPAWLVEEVFASEVSEPRHVRYADALRHAADLGAQLRRVHQVRTLGFGKLSDDLLNAPHATMTDWLDHTLRDFSAAEAQMPPAAVARVAASRAYLSALPPAAPRLCHADLWPGNYLVLRDGGLVIIDWASAHGCDPAFDIAIWHFAVNDAHMLAALLQAYAPDDPSAFVQRVMALADCYAATLLTHDFSWQQIDVAQLHAHSLNWLTASRDPSAVTVLSHGGLDVGS